MRSQQRRESKKKGDQTRQDRKDRKDRKKQGMKAEHEGTRQRKERQE